ncbi:myosin light chain kinase, smooth muscle [Elysia marginata]|uniref:Myosin light chain kinase, smooth muscle n=1 Tax=Elysia marginata TaxID=1093978 RepID=A0AAV4EJK0_9GAST|nr:myosin light chain kinase, smooth muscle [Elysia marginata]
MVAFYIKANTWFRFVDEEAPFERRDVTVKSDRWVTDLYTVDSLLGKGKFGEVKKCQERKTGRQLAAKFIEVNGPQDRNDVLNELEIMKNLQHPRLLQLYDAFEIRDKFCLVMELVNGGELFERVINDDFILTEKACVMFTRQICDGVAFMHSKNILHLDMKNPSSTPHLVLSPSMLLSAGFYHSSHLISDHVYLSANKTRIDFALC